MKREDLVGKRFGRFVVLAEAAPVRCEIADKKCTSGSRFKSFRRLLVLCACGERRTVAPLALKNGTSRSCGCLAAEVTTARNFRHGKSHLPEYKIWAGIIKRCENPNAENYPLYGGRGIKMHAEWRSNFSAFFAALGPLPTRKHSIDRIDNNAGYVPGNVRWATAKEQILNRRKTVKVTWKGVTKPLHTWAQEADLSYKALWSRFARGERGDRLFRPLRRLRTRPPRGQSLR